MSKNKSQIMKNFILTLILLVTTFTMLGQSKLGTIDVDFILSKMPEIETVQKDLKTYGETLDSQLQEKMTAYQAKLDEYNKNVENYSEQKITEQQTAIFELEEDITKFRQNGIQLMRIKEDELKRPLYMRIAEVMDVIAKEQNYTQILNTSADSSIVYLDPKLDITLAVLAKMGIEVEE